MGMEPHGERTVTRPKKCRPCAWTSVAISPEQERLLRDNVDTHSQVELADLVQRSPTWVGAALQVLGIETPRARRRRIAAEARRRRWAAQRRVAK